MKSWIFCLVGLFLVVLYDLLQAVGISKMKYIDELLCVCLATAAIIAIMLRGRVRLFRWERDILLAAGLLMVAGIIPYLIGSPNVWSAAFFDMVVFFKFLISYFSVRILLCHWRILHWGTVVCRWHLSIVVIIAILLAANKFMPIFPRADQRFGMFSEELFFGHPSRYAFFCIYSFVVLMPFLMPKKRLPLLGILGMGILSLRFKYFAFFPLGLAAILLGERIPKIRWQSPKFLGSIAILVVSIIFIAWNQVVYHFSYSSYEIGFGRAGLLYESFAVAKEHFPLGSGFGTYGSWASAIYYSPLYFKLGLDQVYGLSPEHYGYVADTYWPMVLGQFGLIGFMSMLWIFSLFLRHLIRLYNYAPAGPVKRLYLSGLLLLITLLLDSSSDAIFSQNRAVVSFFYLALVMNYATEKNSKKEQLVSLHSI
jgi:hypothetical protein